jgi:putative Ca2+/H+ antiporter (TMEM165/GDT1 family)
MTTAFSVSALVVALAETGDKTQLLSLLRAARFRKPLQISLGILVVTLANHALAGAVGERVRIAAAATFAVLGQVALFAPYGG